MTARLRLVDIHKDFGRGPVLRELSFDIGDGEFVALLGPSGCGKSTTLAIVAGFERPDRGEVLLNGRPITAVPTQRRNIGIVFQDYALFLRMTVRENLEFGLKLRGLGRRARRAHLDRFVDRLDIAALIERPAASLNVSERQKVALARALVCEPSVILLDEPMSNQDAAVRAALRRELKLIQKEFGQTVLYVTHDQVEAMSMADRIVVMRDGAIEQAGTPREIYSSPRTRFVAQFIGEPAINVVEAQVDGAGVLSTEVHGPLTTSRRLRHRGRCLLAIRPHAVRVAERLAPGAALLRIADVENLGSEEILHFAYGDGALSAVAPRHSGRIDEYRQVAFDLDEVHLFDLNGARLDKWIEPRPTFVAAEGTAR